MARFRRRLQMKMMATAMLTRKKKPRTASTPVPAFSPVLRPCEGGNVDGGLVSRGRSEEVTDVGVLDEPVSVKGTLI